MAVAICWAYHESRENILVAMPNGQCRGGGINAAAVWVSSTTTSTTTKTGYYRLCARPPPPPPPISMFNWPMMVVVVVELLRKERRRKNLSVKLTQPLTSISHYLSLNPFLNGWNWQKPHTNTQLSWGSLARWWIRQGVLFLWHIALAWQRVHRIVSVPLGRWRPGAGAALSSKTVISRCDRVMIALMTVHTSSPRPLSPAKHITAAAAAELDTLLSSMWQNIELTES